MVALERDFQTLVVPDILAVELEGLDLMRGFAVDDMHALGILVKLRITRPGFIPQHMLYHAAELRARHFDHPDLVVKRRILHHVLVLDHRSELLLADRAGAHHHNVKAGLPLDRIRIEIAHFRLLLPGRVCQLPRPARDHALILFIRFGTVAVEKLLHDRILRRGILIDRHALPFEMVDHMIVDIIGNVKSPDDARAGARLYDRDIVDIFRLLHKGVAVSADDQVYAPLRIQQLRQLFVLFKADMRQQDDHIRMDRAVVVADNADLLCSLLHVNEGADQLFLFRGIQHLLRQDPDKQNAQATDLDIDIRPEHSAVIHGHEHICVDDREFRAFFQKQQVRNAVIHLMIADRGHVRIQVIHQVDRGESHIFGIYDRPAEHVSGYGIDDIFLFLPDPVQIAGKPGQASAFLSVRFLRKKVPVHIIGMKKRNFP